ncbi:MAG: dihydrolipoyl dehydrogenase [Candidatus Promineifilaceae bacterium]|nr:dihydrolipoyl dehydrogenase [Candidatus Promineifilaceae bacterium]
MGEETFEAEVVVIGGGTGGYTAAFRAADLGRNVTLINAEEQLGGVCLRRGCIPSKALLEAAGIIYVARQAQEWGLSFEGPDIDLAKLRQWKDGVVARLVNGLDTLSQEREINLIQAQATFEDEKQLRLQGAEISHVTFEQAIIATGSQPRPLPDSPFGETDRIMDAAEALHLEEIPANLLVVGGGYIGLELGSVYAALGSAVTLVEMTAGLLPGVERDLVRLLAQQIDERFEAVHLNTRVDALNETDDGVEAVLEGDGPSQGTYDRVIVAVGREPRSANLGLENTAVELDDDGFIVVDQEQRTAVPHLFAVGDVAGRPLLAHKSMYEGKVAAEVIAGQPAAADARCIPAVVYTDPQIAWCGLSEEAAQEQGREVEVGRFRWRASGRALTEGAAEGLTKIVFDPQTERVLGVGMVGGGAAELIAEGALAVEMGAVAQDLANTIHPHPTLSETTAEAAEAFLGLATHLLPDSQ